MASFDKTNEPLLMAGDQAQHRHRRASGASSKSLPGRGEGHPDKGGSKTLVTVLIIFGLIASWVAMSELLQGLQHDYAKPYFISWVVHAGYSSFLLVWLPMYLYGWYNGEEMSCSKRYGHSPKKLAGAGFIISILIMACAYFWYLSLSRTTVAANNSIYQSSPAFVFAFSILAIKEEVTTSKVVSVVLSIIGVVLISVAPTHTKADDVHPEPIGYVYVIISVICYSLYEVFQKKYLEAEEHPSSPAQVNVEDVSPYSQMLLEEGPETGHADRTMNGGVDASPRQRSSPSASSIRIKFELSCGMLGSFGLWSALTLWPGIFAVHAAGIENFELPPHHKALLLALNAGLDSFYNVLLMFGVLVTSPLFMSIGCILVLPVSLIVDRIFHDTELAALALVGVFFVLVGFVLVTVPVEVLWRLVFPKPEQHDGQDGLGSRQGSGSTVGVSVTSASPLPSGRGSLA